MFHYWLSGVGFLDSLVLGLSHGLGVLAHCRVIVIWEIIKTTIIYGTIITRALLHTVHESKSQRDVQIYGVSSPPSHCTGYRASSSQEERIHSWQPSWWMSHDCSRFFFFLQSRHRSIDLDCCAAHTLSSSCLLHLFIYMLAVNATISSELFHARSLHTRSNSVLFKWHHPYANVLKV